MLQQVGLDNFTVEVMESSEPVVVDFYADFCGPCRSMKPMLASLASTGGKVVALDIEAEPELTEHFGVEALPTMIAFQNGEEIGRLVGVQSMEAVKALFGPVTDDRELFGGLDGT